MRPQPLMRSHKLGKAAEPQPIYDFPYVIPACCLIVIGVILLVMLTGCGTALYRLGTSFTDHTATMESVTNIQEAKAQKTDTPTLVSTPEGRWWALGNGVEAQGESPEAAAQAWKQKTEKEETE